MLGKTAAAAAAAATSGAAAAASDATEGGCGDGSEASSLRLTGSAVVNFTPASGANFAPSVYFTVRQVLSDVMMSCNRLLDEMTPPQQPALPAVAAAGAAPAVGSPLSPLSSHGFLQPQIASQMQAPIKPRVRRKSSSRGHTCKNSIHASGADASNDGEQEGEQLIQALEMHMVSHGVDQAVLQEQERLKRLVEQHNKRVAAMQMNE
ncbi:hypothetical protein OEZ86_001108 [Tetradesmus obliquus]|nr:hypothetical protein OEZ86_001108 [Tetradesmus obliquus]